MFTDNTKYLPFPEAIDRDDVPDRFDVQGGAESRTDLAHGVMVVNGGDVCECGQDHARGSRIHEMGHVAFTPADWQKRAERARDGAPVLLVNAAEDARLTRLRYVHGLDAMPPLLCEKQGQHYNAVMNAVKSGNLLALAGIITAAYASGDQDPVSAAVSKVYSDMMAKGQEDEANTLWQTNTRVQNACYEVMWRKEKPTFRSSLQLAKQVEAIANDELTAYKETKELKEIAKKTKVVKGSKPKSTKGSSTQLWGDMSIVKLPLTRRSPLGMERKFTARDEGPIPTRFDRWSIDKRVFRMKKRVKGAAILVDCSGSMSWSEEDLERVLDEVPAATVALYSGQGRKGELVIVAYKGRRANMKAVRKYLRGGNVIDGEALSWLADQPQTVKVWMSDGGVTGINDAFLGGEHTKRMERDVLRQLRRGGIMRVRDAGRVMEVLTGKRKFAPDRKFTHPFR